MLASLMQIGKKKRAVDDELYKNTLQQAAGNFWRKVSERILDVVFLLSTNKLAFWGSSDNMKNYHKGNFLSIIELLAKYDPSVEDS